MNTAKHALTFFLSAMLTLSAWAVPAYRGWQERTLTDGTSVHVRLIGDEFYHFWETQDGKIAIEQEDGTFVISDKQSPTSKQVIARRKAAAQRKGAARVRKNYGAIQPTKLLVLLVNFSDKSMKSTHNNAFFDNLLNGSFPSVQDYFKQSSGNTYVPEFDVFGPYTLDQNMAYYGGNDSDGNDEHPDQMVVDACAKAYADGCDFSNYDTNNDGKVDNIYVIYAGYGEAAGAPANTIWPHSWEIYSQYVSGTLKYNGKTLGHYACSAELSGKSGSNSDGVGTFAHEFSHVIGLPDYYDTDYGTNSDNGVTPGEWTLMDQGSYNGSGMYPPLYSIYDKYFMGWTTPKFLAKDEVKNVTMTTTWNDGYQINGGASIVACTNTKTVYYIENRQKSGYDQYLPGHGMVVWTVTYNSTRWNNNDLNNTAGTLRYTIVPADGKTSNYGNATDPFPGTSNKKTWTPFTGCALTEITESGSSINFSYNGGVPKTTWDYVLYGENCTYPEDGEINKGNKLELTITPSSGYVLSDAACWDVQMGGTKLTYGTDFTYNAGTNKFTINSVTGDVEIIVEGGRTVNWNAQGSLYQTNVSVGNKITLPDAPANCSASRQFVGWCTNSTYKSADTPPTYAKTGDAYSVANYYAVYADVSGGGSADATYTFTSKSWEATEGDWTSGQDGTAYLNSGVQVTQTTTGANATCPASYSNISSIVVSYCTNASKGAGSIKLSVNGTEVSESVTSEGGTTPRNLELDFSETTPSGAPVITVNCGTNSIYICGLTITYGSASYSGFSTDCTAPDPCALTSISLNTDGVKKAFTTNETFNADGLVVTANYSNCSSKTVTPNSVSTPDMSSNGNKTVTVSYTENAVTKTATYNITVSAPTTYAIRFLDGTTVLKEEALILGAEATPPTVDDCEEYEFVGWYTSTLATDNTTSYSWISDFTVSGAQDYYAVFSHTEGGSSAPIRRANAAVNDVLWAEDFSGYSANNVPSGSVANSHTGTTVYDNGSVTYACTLSGTKIYGDGGPNGNENILIAKGNGTFAVSGIPTGGATELTLTYAKSGGGTLGITVSSNASISGNTITVTSGTTVDITFTNTSSGSNLRFDDASVTVKTAGSGGGSSSTTYYTTTKDCTIPTEVTVKFEANGGEGTMTDQTIDYNTATALKANTFERTGYTFLGWATSSSGTKVYDDEEAVTLTKKVTTLYAVWEKNSWKVWFTTPTGATSVTANGVTTSPLTVEYGESVTIVITPDAEHVIGSVTATGGASLSGEGGTRTFTMPDADVAISISMANKPTYTINFINMGETISSQQVIDGQAAIKPSDPSACEGYDFVGWWTAELDADNTTAESWITTFIATGNQNYYAVYSHSEGGSSAPIRRANAAVNDVLWAEDFSGYSANDVPSGATANSHTGTTVYNSGSVTYSVTNGSGTTKVFNEALATGTAPELLIAKSGGSFSIAGIPTGGATAMTLTFKTNQTSGVSVTSGTTGISVGSVSISSNTATCEITRTEDVDAFDLTITKTSSGNSREDNFSLVVKTAGSGGGSSSTTTYTTDPTCTPCDNKVTLTKGGESHGTFTVDKADGAYNNCTSDFVVMVSNIVSADGYRLKDVTATGGNNEVTGPDGSGNYTVTYAKGNSITSTVTANFEEIPSHTVIWHSNGDESNTASYQEGKPIVFPETADGCDGKVFMGWSAVEVAEQDDAPEYTASALMGDHDVTYYAVFAEASTGSGSTFDGTTGGSFKIYAQVDDTKYYATGTGGKIASTTNEAEATSYTFTKVTDGWTIQTGETYITYSSSTNLGTSGSAYTWTLTSGTKGTWRFTSETSTRGWIYRAGQDVFGGYSTGNVTAGGNEYYDLEIGSGSGTTYSGYTTSCTTCENKVTLTKGAGSHGTFTLNKADGTYDNCKTNFIVTVSGITPDDGYYCSGVTATGGSHAIVAGPDGSGNYTVSYTKGNTIATTITANFAEIPMYTVTWDVAGTTSTETHYAGVALEGIPAPTSDDCDGLKKFVGWTATANYSSEDTAPDDLFTDPTTKTTPDNNTTTYYAVFAEEEEGGSDGSTYTLVEESLTDWSGNYIIVNYSDNNKAMTNTVSGGEFGSKDIVPSGKQITTTDNTIIWIFEKGTGSNAAKYSVKSKDSGKYAAIGSTTTSGSLNDAASYFEITHYSTSHQNDVAASSGRFFSYYSSNSTFRTYAGTSSGVYLYRSDGSSTTYSGYTTTCGAAISAKNIGWITAAKGQKVKRVINVTAKGFDEATTLTASSGDAQFKATLAKTGLSTTLTVEYTPTASDNRTANVEIVLTAGGITRTITVSGRSLPDEFLAITKKDDTWYALPANMNGGENQYEGVVVTPDNDSDPTMVAVAPSTIVYGLRSADNSRYAENGAYVRLAGNGSKALWGNTAADALTIQNSETIDLANAENYEWSLSTTDGIHYTIANPHHADYASGRVLAFGDKFGLYKTATVFFLVPTGCNSRPLEVNVSARRVDATFSWVSNASSVTINLYTDEEKTAFATSATATSVPYYMTGLEESTHYWFTLTPEGETACAVSGDFETSGPTIDVVEWTDESVIVSVDKDDEFHPSIVIDGEVEHGAGTGNVATELFFSKYFEGAGDMKLVAIFNGTKETINLSNYSIFIECRNTSDEWAPTSDVTLNLSSLGSIASGQEIIFFSRQLGTGDLASCSDDFLDDKVTSSSSAESNPRWVECDGTPFTRISFNGNDPIMLYKNSDMIDIIGSEGDPATTKNCLTGNSEKGWAGTAKNMDKGKSPSDPVFDAFYEASSKTPVSTQDSIDLLTNFGINLTADEISITTARCILFRDKRVVSGDSAVLMNGETFVTFTNHDTFKSEWTGRAVCMDDAMKTVL